MKIFLRALLFVALSLWLGAEFFFPFVAATVFTTLHPDTHTAGQIVGHLLSSLHTLGLISSMVIVVALAAAGSKGFYRPIPALLPIGIVLLMAALTLHSQRVITPAMERDRLAAGGSVDAASETNPARRDFKRQHNNSERVEGLILLLGLVAMVCLANEETALA
jgi:hypothetical protein